MKITVIGESNIDIAVMPHPEANAKGCTPGKIDFYHGGVARNIAHNLCLLGHEVRLVSVFGSDEFAAQLVEYCKHLGMDLSLSTRFDNAKSPIFLSFIDETCNMQSAISDVCLNDRMDLDWLKGKIDGINKSDMVVADTLLSTDALIYLMNQCEVPLYIDTVSPGKALRLAEALKKTEKQSVFALKCNLSEAFAITKTNQLNDAAMSLNAKGIKHIYMTMGANGAIHCSENIVTSYPALPVQVVNVTGSGDAFFAGVIHAHTTGHYGKDAVVFGLKAAQHNIKSEAPVNPTLRVSVFDD